MTCLNPNPNPNPHNNDVAIELYLFSLEEKFLKVEVAKAKLRKTLYDLTTPRLF